MRKQDREIRYKPHLEFDVKLKEQGDQRECIMMIVENKGTGYARDIRIEYEPDHSFPFYSDEISTKLSEIFGRINYLPPGGKEERRLTRCRSGIEEWRGLNKNNVKFKVTLRWKEAFGKEASNKRCINISRYLDKFFRF